MVRPELAFRGQHAQVEVDGLDVLINQGDGVLAGRVKMKLQNLVLIGKAGADSNFAAVFIRHFHDMPCVLHYERCIAITESNILENGSNCVGGQNVHGSLLLADLRQRRACAHDRSASRKGVIVAAQKSPAVRSDWRIRIMVPRLSRRHRCRQTNQNNEQQTFPCSVHHLFSSVSMGDYTANNCGCDRKRQFGARNRPSL